MGSLTRIERIVCGPLIRRQLDRNPRADREIAKFGPVGEVRLCRARAMIVYAYPLGFIGVGLSFVGSTAPGTGVAVFLLLVLGIVAISRIVSASVAGRRWRRSRSSSLAGEPPA
jgi:hypothetical protein